MAVTALAATLLSMNTNRIYTMKALIQSNKIVQVAEKEFPVHPSLQWVDCPDDTTTRHQYVNGSFSEPGQAKQKQPDETEALIRREMREMAIESLKSKGKLKQGAKI